MKHENSVRFWVFWNASYARIRLSVGRPLIIGSSQRTDEGYNSVSRRYDFDGKTVTVELSEGGCDCDGPYQFASTQTCDRDSLDAIRVEDIRVPKWKRIDSSQFDAFAAAMGY